MPIAVTHMRSSTLVVVFLFLILQTPMANVTKADDSTSSAIEVTNGYDDAWWVCYDDDCSDGAGVDQLDFFKLKVFDGDEVTWEVYNRADPHYVWLGVTFFNSDGSVIDLPADECSTCSDDDMMWVGDYETDSVTIQYSAPSSGEYVYARVHAHDGNGGDGTWYDMRVDVDTSGRTSSSGNSNSGSTNSGDSCSSSSDCPYRSGKIGTCISGACIYTDIPSPVPEQTSSTSSDIEIPDKLLVYAILLPVLFVVGLIRSLKKGRRLKRKRKSKPVNLGTFPEPSMRTNNDYGLQSNASNQMYSSMNQNFIPQNQVINPNNSFSSHPSHVFAAINKPNSNQNFSPSSPPPSIPDRPRMSLTGEFDDNGYEWLKWNANGLWYWRTAESDEWTEFNN